MRVLDKVPCIYYLVQFRKNKGKNVLALLNFGSEVNAMTLAYAAHLGLKVRVTSVDAQKIDGFALATYGWSLLHLRLSISLITLGSFRKLSY